MLESEFGPLMSSTLRVSEKQWRRGTQRGRSGWHASRCASCPLRVKGEKGPPGCSGCWSCEQRRGS